LTDIRIDNGRLLSGAQKLRNEEAAIGSLAGIPAAEHENGARALLQDGYRRLPPRLGSMQASHAAFLLVALRPSGASVWHARPLSCLILVNRPDAGRGYYFLWNGTVPSCR
jgi:hypothetical protein